MDITTLITSMVPSTEDHITKKQRLLMIAAGGYLLYKALRKKEERNILETITAGVLVYRGLSGYLQESQQRKEPVYDNHYTNIR